MSRRFIIESASGIRPAGKNSPVADLRVRPGPAPLDSHEHPHNPSPEGVNSGYDSDSNFEDQLMPPAESPARLPGRKRSLDESSLDADEPEPRPRGSRTSFVEKDADPYVTAEQVRYAYEERGKSMAAMQLRSASTDRDFQEQLRTVRAMTEQDVRRALTAKYAEQFGEIGSCLGNMQAQFKRLQEYNQRIRQEAEKRINEVIARHQERETAMDSVITWLVMKLRLEQYQQHVTKEEAHKHVAGLTAVVAEDLPLAKRTIEDLQKQVESLKQQLYAARAHADGPVEALKVAVQEAEAPAVHVPSAVVHFQSDELQEQVKMWQQTTRGAKSPNVHLFKALGHGALSPGGPYHAASAAASAAASGASSVVIKEEPQALDVEQQFEYWQQLTDQENAQQLEKFLDLEREMQHKDLQIGTLQEEVDYWRSMVHSTLGEPVPPSELHPPSSDGSVLSLLASPERDPSPIATAPVPRGGSFDAPEFIPPMSPLKVPMPEFIPPMSPLKTANYLPMSPLKLGLLACPSPLKPPATPLASLASHRDSPAAAQKRARLARRGER
eukprot:TRINITY_DN7208_c0_g2_i1.p1 TRINITY_DN7208_c0_g2~~TRINITY_DN7208_c0_g2_i1.p1  ORF type:complete len:555 (-),score=242.03 TRINITY_DN7208_c0_g2_i1:406-2070(-)